ncbi:MAG: phospho-N-acetylmuramoyl-pentapeptide-transferase [Clostridia bacterium]|nr:phospho-N-acetylmuramoyl-pentapeptide-transferase [Clostridia bacterium]
MDIRDLILLFMMAMPAATLLCALGCRIMIPVLRRHHIGQHIYTEYGPAWHAGKQGTPTMGGVCFIIPMLLCVLPYVIVEALQASKDSLNADTNLIPLALCVALGVGNAMIGFVDDYAKLLHKKNQGLTSWQKLLLQAVVAGGYVFGMAATGHMSTVVEIHFLSLEFDLGVLYYALAVLMILAMVNSTNLTDGVDGLASSVALAAALCSTIIAFVYTDAASVLLCAVMIGSMIGFLMFNYHPAKVFMGDTGSLYLGGIFMGMGFMLGEPLLMILICGVFVLDMLSSFAQIISYKLFKKRIFKMAPVHHHFEKMGWSEEKIVYVFAGVGLFLGGIGVLLAVL